MSPASRLPTTIAFALAVALVVAAVVADSLSAGRTIAGVRRGSTRALHTSSVQGPGSVRLDLVSEFGGVSRAIAVSGDRVYLGSGQSVVAFDVLDTSAPRRIGSSAHLGAEVHGIVVEGDYAYVAAAHTGLHILDTTAPALPALGSLDTPGEAEGVAVAGDTVYVADGSDGLQVVDVGDRRNPRVLGSLPTRSFARAVAVAGDHVFVAERDLFEGGLRVVSVGDLRSPRQVAYLDLGLGVDGVAVRGDVAFLSGQEGRLFRVDISQPDAPLLVAAGPQPGMTPTSVVVVPTPGPPPDRAFGLVLDEDLAYVAHGTDGLRICIIARVTEIRCLGNHDTPGDARAVAHVGRTVFVADGEQGMQVVDLARPASPVQLASVGDTAGQAWDVVVSGDMALIADHAFGLRVIDVSDPAAPRLRGLMPTDGNPVEVVARNRTVFLALEIEELEYREVYRGGLAIASVSEAGEPTYGVSTRPTMNVVGLAVGERYAYLAEQIPLALPVQPRSGLQILDVARPLRPRPQGHYMDPFLPTGVDVADAVAFVTDYGAGLWTVDVSDPDEPERLGHVTTRGEALDVVVHGETAYVADGVSGLTIVDVTTAVSPTVLGIMDTPGQAREVVVIDNWAYVADARGGVRLIDVSDPTEPRELAHYTTPGKAYGLAVKGEYVYVVLQEAVFLVLRTVRGAPSPTATSGSATPTARAATATATPPFGSPAPEWHPVYLPYLTNQAS